MIGKKSAVGKKSTVAIDVSLYVNRVQFRLKDEEVEKNSKMHWIKVILKRGKHNYKTNGYIAK